jgi:hypothetical protein
MAKKDYSVSITISDGVSGPVFSCFVLLPHAPNRKVTETMVAITIIFTFFMMQNLLKAKMFIVNLLYHIYAL